MVIRSTKVSNLTFRKKAFNLQQASEEGLLRIFGLLIIPSHNATDDFL